MPRRGIKKRCHLNRKNVQCIKGMLEDFECEDCGKWNRCILLKDTQTLQYDKLLCCKCIRKNYIDVELYNNWLDYNNCDVCNKEKICVRIKDLSIISMDLLICQNCTKQIYE